MVSCCQRSYDHKKDGVGRPSRFGNFKCFLYLAIVGIIFFTALPYLQGYYIETYLWQSTTFADWLRPVKRDSCPLPAPITETKGLRGRPKIGLLMVWAVDGNWPDALMERVVKNREAYCKKHGYTLLHGNEMIDPDRPVAWTKLTAAEYHLSHTFDYVMYMDMDIVIMNMERKIEELIASSNGGDLIVTEDWSGLNSGVWIANNTPWTRKFLRLAFDQKQLDVPYGANGGKHPFEYEQRAFHYLMDTEVWRNRGLPRYKSEEVVENRKHVKILPQCAMNSFSMHPLEYRGSREVSHYVPGDFLIHFAGKKGKLKVDILNHYLDLSEGKRTSDVGATTIA